MPPIALALVLLAAVLHAGWNYLAKASRDTAAFLWWAMFFGTLGYGTYILLTSSIHLAREVWLLYALSIGAEVAYVVTLVRGYEFGDLSVVYPLARGSAPILVTLWSGLFLGERLPPIGYLGVAVMVAGIFIVSIQPAARALPDGLVSSQPIPGSVSVLSGQTTRRAALWALASGVFISIYSVLDKVIVKTVPPLDYNFWVYAGIAVLWAPFVWSGGRSKVTRNWGELQVNWPRILIGSAMSVGAYSAALVALTLTSASYVVAGRGTSVIIGALLGWLALREEFGGRRVAGAILMVLGLAMITFAY